MPGSLTYTGVSELTFTPARPFAFDTTYKVELQALETRDGVRRAAGQGRDVELQRSRRRRSRCSAGRRPRSISSSTRSTMEVAFSGAVLPNVATASDDVHGRRQARRPAIAVLPSARPNVVIVADHRPADRARREARARDRRACRRALGTKSAGGERRVRRQRRQGGRRSRPRRSSRARTASTSRSCATTRRRRPATAAFYERRGLLQPVAALPARRRARSRASTSRPR